MNKSKIGIRFFKNSENVIFIFASLCCIAAISGAFFIKCVDVQNIILSLASSILAAVLLPFFLNVGKALQEQRVIQATCNSVIELAVVLVNCLNSYLIRQNKTLVTNYSDLKSEKHLSEIDWNGFSTLDELFSLIAYKLSYLKDTHYLDNKDTIEWAICRVQNSIPNEIVPKDYCQLYRSLVIAVGVVGIIKPPIFKVDYIEMFNCRIKESNKKIREDFLSYTEEYIISSIERDLSEIYIGAQRGE